MGLNTATLCILALVLGGCASQMEEAPTTTINPQENRLIGPFAAARISESSFDGTSQLGIAIAAAKQDNYDPLLALGLDKDDVTDLKARKLPPLSSMDRLALNLNLDFETVQGMLEELLEKIR